MKPIHHLVIFSTLNHSVMASSRFLVALYAVHLQASPVVVGILVSLFSVVPMFISVPMGRFADRKGTRMPLLTTTCLSACGAVLPFFWPQVGTLFITAVTVGSAYFALYIVNISLSGRYGDPAERPSNFSHMSLGIAGANGAGPLMTGFAIDHIGFANTFLALALIPVASLAIALTSLPQFGPVAGQPQAAAVKRSVLDLLRNPDMRPAYVISIYFVLAWDIFMVMTPIYGAQLSLSASQIGTVVGAFSIAVFVIRIFIGPLSRYFKPMQLLLLSQLVAASAMLSFGLTGIVPLLIVFAFVQGLGQGVGGPMVTTALYEVSPSDRVSEAIGLRMTVGHFCAAILPLIAGGTGSLIGVAPVFWLTAALLFLGAWMERGQWHPSNPKD